MAEHLAAEVASTLQSASINQAPDPKYDSNPDTAALQQIPVQIESEKHTSFAADVDPAKHAEEIPVSVLRPPPRKPALPPIPDLRFEQSYLASIRHCEDYYSLAWVTFKDQVILPLSQGLIWNLAIFGWRSWNTAVKFQGTGFGAKLRRWWWGVNNWNIPDQQKMGDTKEYYGALAGSAGDD